ncbi:MAG: hypothetical protein L3J89_13750 [Gammaproteobacteria bacterium]|nr:hypothetical protein [Gammaproteobacteria bacterium]
MYLDANGYVTIGIGHLLGSIADAQKLGFKKSNNMPASKDEIKSDFEAVTKQPANRLTSMYKKHTKLTLSITEINKLTDKHIASFEKELEKIYAGFNAFPTEVRLALFDLIFNLGMTKLKNKWPLFNSAIKAKDWQKAADNSNRKSPIPATRNKHVKGLLEKAAKSVKP